MKKLVAESLYQFNEELLASEAIYGFAGWLTTRNKKTIMSSKDDSAIVADLVNKFIKTQNLREPRENWQEELLPVIESKNIKFYMKNLVREKLYESVTSVKKGFHVDIEQETLYNPFFRKVLYTGHNLQLVLMNLRKGEEIGMETHEENDQFFRFEAGSGKCVVNGHEYFVKDGDSVIIPAGTEHNIINIGNVDLQMYTIYAPAHHKEGTLFRTKEEAEEKGQEFDGITTE